MAMKQKPRQHRATVQKRLHHRGYLVIHQPTHLSPSRYHTSPTHFLLELYCSRVAQWKRAGLITQRTVDRNHALLTILRWYLSRLKALIDNIFHPSLTMGVLQWCWNAEWRMRFCGFLLFLLVFLTHILIFIFVYEMGGDFLYLLINCDPKVRVYHIVLKPCKDRVIWIVRPGHGRGVVPRTNRYVKMEMQQKAW